MFLALFTRSKHLENRFPLYCEDIFNEASHQAISPVPLHFHISLLPKLS
jgi:hypothetical protein